MKVKCKRCGKSKRVNPSDIKNIENYHCRDCMPYYRAEQREKGIKPEWDWSTQRFLNNLAMANGHESIFLKNNSDTADMNKNEMG